MIVLTLTLFSCGGSSKEQKSGKDKTSTKEIDNPDYNISILIDLSDRITKQTAGMNQDKKDSIIINQIVDEFIEDFNRKGKLPERKGQIKVFFYPTPKIENISEITNLLDLRFSDLKTSKEKREARDNLKINYNKALKQLYSKALEDKHWIGSDIWGFFDTRVEDYCIKEGYRNILVIISDGYIYYQPTWKKNAGGTYPGMTSATISAGQKSITEINKKLSDLEVLFLEVDPYPENQFVDQQKLLSEWFDNMEIKKYKILKTDAPGNNTTPIQNFFTNN